MATEQRFRVAFGFALVGAVLVLAAGGIVWLPSAFAAATANGTVDPSIMRWGFAAAAAATGMSSIAAGYAVGMVGSAGMGTLAEKPELLGRVLVLVGLAEGIAIYGLIVSILILNRLG